MSGKAYNHRSTFNCTTSAARARPISESLWNSLCSPSHQTEDSSRMHSIALISEHASPLATVGGIDAGGQNIYVAQVAKQLARLGYQVDVFTRRDSARLPEIVEYAPGVRVVNVPAGPPQYVRKEEMLPLMNDFCEFVCDF